MSNYNFAPTLDGLNNIDGNNINSNTLITDYLTVNLASSVPTVAPATNDNTIASTAYVTTAISNSGSNYVDLTSTQNITGEKTFSNANTYITGNTVTNSIQSSNPVNNINIGTQLTTGDINLGNVFIGPTMNVALNWGTSSNGGILSLNGGSFNLISSGIYTQRSGPTFGMTMGDTQSTGIMNIANRSDRSGAININTGGTSTAPINISSLTTNNAPITIGSTSSTTQTCDMNAMTNFSKIVTCPIAPVNANDLCNKTYVDSLAPTGYVDLTTAQTVGGAKTFTSNIIAGAGIIPTSGTNLTLTTTGGEDVIINGSNDITFNSAFNTAFNAGAYGSFQAGVGYTFVCNGGYGFKFIDNAIGGGFESTTSNNIVNTSVNNYNYNTASLFSPYSNGPNRGAIYDKSSSVINPSLTFTNGTQTDSGAIFTAMTITAPINNTCSCVSVKIAFDLIAWATFGVTGSGTIGLQFNSYTLSILKNGVSYTPSILNHFSNATGTTQNWTKSGNQTNISGLGAYFGTIDAIFDIDINNITADVYQIRITPTMTITYSAFSFDGFKFSCRASTSGGTNGNPFFTGVRTSYTGGTLTYASTVPSFVDSSISKVGLSYPVPASSNYCFMPINNNIVPAGSISMYVLSTPPEGFLICNGASISITTYGNLFAVIGFTYGGSLSTGLFFLPNFSGCFIRGAGNQTIGGVNYSAGAVGTPQNDQVLNPTYSTQNGYHNLASGGTGKQCPSRFQITTDPNDIGGITANFPREGTENRPVNHSLYYIIKY